MKRAKIFLMYLFDIKGYIKDIKSYLKKIKTWINLLVILAIVLLLRFEREGYIGAGIFTLLASALWIYNIIRAGEDIGWYREKEKERLKTEVKNGAGRQDSAIKDF